LKITVHNTLHFRVSALFLALLALVAVGYFLWINWSSTQPVWNEGEQEWLFNSREAEVDSLGSMITIDNSLSILTNYATTVSDYDFQLSYFDINGTVIATTHLFGSAQDQMTISTDLLKSMAGEDWDFNTYPIPTFLGAFENRILDVLVLQDDSYLVSCVLPMSTPDIDVLEEENFSFLMSGIPLILLYAAVVGIILMTWISKRIGKVKRDMAAFADGDLTHRSVDNSSDDIGALSRGFNKMAGALEESIQKLKQSEEYRTMLTANISHDLRTPMASLRGWIETFSIRGASMDEDERQKHLNTITSNMDHLEGLIERLFELTQLDSGQIEFQMEEFPLEELARDVLGRFHDAAERKSVNLEFTSEDNLPFIKADPMRIAQVLQNLTENALKFTESGSVTISLKVATAGILVEVTDTGTGIPSEDLPHIFERFFTTDRSRTHKGTGLGLAIAHRIIIGHGSELTVQSTEGAGTTFGFILTAS
jgi:signal transduction histidine kinase